MWKDFALKLLRAYKKSDSYDEKVYEEVFQTCHEAIYKKGHPQSIRLEFIWFLTRVRYFELIPNWEIARVRDDTNTYFAQIEEFRNTLVQQHGVKAKGIYSDEKLSEMQAKKAAIVDFLQNWENADDSVYDQDGEKHRRVIRAETRDLSREANRIYNWYFNMAYKQFKWKEGRPKDFVSANFLWSDPTAKYVRPHLMSHSRLGWRRYVWRDLVKFNFHMKRRI